MSIVERVRALGLQLDQLVVIGGGVMDALGLRAAEDIDLVLSEDLFDLLRDGTDWQVDDRQGDPRLFRGEVEAFMSWGNQGQPNFTSLYADGFEVQGVRFCDPQFVIDWKRSRGSDKDRQDIALLEEYLG